VEPHFLGAHRDGAGGRITAPEVQLPGGPRLIGVPLIGLGAVLALMSYRRWAANERAMRLGVPLPPSNLTRVLALGVAAAATIAAVVAAFGASK
jgi:uncharacterized membrane protein YidH (DUF202 family)